MTNSTYCRQPQHVENLPHLFEPFLLQGFSPISEHGGLLNGAYSMGPTQLGLLNGAYSMGPTQWGLLQEFSDIIDQEQETNEHALLDLQSELVRRLYELTERKKCCLMSHSKKKVNGNSLVIK